MAPIEVVTVHVPTDDVRRLVGALDKELSGHYAAEQRHGLALDAIFKPHIHFFVARLDGGAVGCGGVALLAGFAEVKRMYVDPASRSRGVAQAILARIEAEARGAGRTLLRLETGDRQLAAIQMYGRLGFKRCSAFGDYIAMPPAATATSVFMEKSL